MGDFFGTDGIRGKANKHPMTAEVALKVGRAVASVKRKLNKNKPFIIIGKDTRISGDMIEHALVSGILSVGVDVRLAGVVPTPCVAYLARTLNADAGIVISASHNPYYDNGIKIFNGDGYKLSDAQEEEIESLISNPEGPDCSDTVTDTGKVFNIENSADLYKTFLLRIPEKDITFKGLKCVVDCSNGASSYIASDVFQSLGLDVEIINASPDGKNINSNCGSEHTEQLSRKVITNKAHIGLALDGDADRLIAIDENGSAVSGDQIIAIFADYLQKKGQLTNNTVVTTVMSNIGLCSFLKKRNIQHIMSGVGDKLVVKEMRKTGAIVGGEDSGHLIFADCHTTGDGLVSAIHLLKILKESSVSFSELASKMTLYPQILENIDVREKPDIHEISEITDVINEVEKLLGDNGRVLVRYSGTQPMCRVMVEGPTVDETQKYCNMISEVVKKRLG